MEGVSPDDVAVRVSFLENKHSLIFIGVVQ